MVALVAGALENAEEDETGRDGGIEDTKEDERRDHERECDLFVVILQRSKGRGCVILCSGISVYDRTHQTENDDLGNGDGPQGLWKIFGVLHLRNEAGDGDLANERIADVQESIHTGHKSGTGSRDDEHDWVADLETLLSA